MTAKMLILVGLTGCGKTTTVEALRDAGLTFTLLPNRRQLTDDILIPQVQAANGEPLRAVTDRAERFAYTHRYREMHPGGMGEVLVQYSVFSNQYSVNSHQYSVFGEQSSVDGNRSRITDHRLLIFDGLRGAHEVTYVARQLPGAWFLFLHTPDGVRVQRLAARGDGFDGMAGGGKTAVSAQPAADARTPAERNALRIVRSERANYDPDATLAALRRHAPDRLIFADTTQHTPAQIAQQAIARLPQ